MVAKVKLINTMNNVYGLISPLYHYKLTPAIEAVISEEKCDTSNLISLLIFSGKPMTFLLSMTHSNIKTLVP